MWWAVCLTQSLESGQLSCLSYFSVAVMNSHDRGNSGEKGRVHHGAEAKEAGAGSSWSHGIGNQEAESAEHSLLLSSLSLVTQPKIPGIIFSPQSRTDPPTSQVILDSVTFAVITGYHVGRF